MNGITANLAQIRPRLGAAQLIAVSKNHDSDAVRAALTAGQRVFGENRVQEAEAKFSALRAQHADIELHLIGPLQTNKVADAVALFDVIQTVDRPRLADALALALRKAARRPRLYIEVNVGHEPQKAGIAPAYLGEFLIYCRNVCQLTIAGLMCIPPQGIDPRPHFITMRALADQYKLQHLSMGMSGDFETAIACGATEVRLGTAIFGERSQVPSQASQL